MSKRRSHGDGGIDQRGENSWRLRYRVNGKRYSKAFRGTLSEARKELRALVRSGDTGEHVEPDRITLAQWIDRWIAAGAPGRSQKKAVAADCREIFGADALPCRRRLAPGACSNSKPPKSMRCMSPWPPS